MLFVSLIHTKVKFICLPPGTRSFHVFLRVSKASVIIEIRNLIMGYGYILVHVANIYLIIYSKGSMASKVSESSSLWYFSSPILTAFVSDVFWLFCRPELQDKQQLVPGWTGWYPPISHTLICHTVYNYTGQALVHT